jgi:hypothetical protein
MSQMRKAIRRCARADQLTQRCHQMLEARHALPAGDRMREALNAGAMALASRSAAWIALAGGDPDTAREHLIEARWYARTHRRIARERAHVPA